jgi:LPS-assembly protein
MPLLAVLGAAFAQVAVDARAQTTFSAPPPPIVPIRPTPGAPPAAPVQAAPLPARGPTTIDAQRIEGIGELEVTARGAAEIKRDDTTIFGEYLKLNRETGLVEGEGGVRIERAGDRLSGTRLRYNTIDETGVLEQPVFVFRRNTVTRGAAEQLEFLGGDRYRLRQANYTTCEPGNDDWRVEADDLVLDYQAEEANVQRGRLRFFDTTIFALPFGTFPLENRRKSGLLTPRFGQSTLRGVEIAAPYYWNIAPEQDMTITPVYMSRRGTQFKTEYRYLDRSFNGGANFEYLGNDRVRDRSRYGMSLQHRHEITPALIGTVDLNKVSDSNYFSDLSSQVRQVSVSHLPRDVALHYSTAIGDQAIGMSARLQSYQTLQTPLAPVGVPYNRLPQINISAVRNDIAGRFDATLPAEYVRFSHPTALDGSRIVVNPSLAAPFLAPGWFVTPKVGFHRASYNLQQVPAGQPAKPDFSVPWVSADAGLIFERDANWFGTALKQTLEPRAYYVYAPYRDQNSIPVFDTGLSDFNYAQMFTENRFSGGDRFGDANQLTLAVTSRLLNANGVESLRATFGQRYYFDDERVGITPAAPLRTTRDSDLLASIGGRITQDWSFDTAVQYNPQGANTQRFTAALRYSPEIAKVVSASYRFNRDQLRQIDISGQWPVATGWYAIGRYNYSFRDSRLLEGLAGLEYNGGCWVFRAVLHRIQAATQLPSTSILFQLEFTGFGEVGTGDVVELLKRNVAGYSVTNPVDSALTPPSARPRFPFEQVF